MSPLNGIDGPLGEALVRRPSPELNDAVVTYIGRAPVDYAAAIGQWERYVTVLEEHGWVPVELEPLDYCPDGVFVEDAAVVLDDLAVIAQPLLDSRRPELASVEGALLERGYRLARLEPPALLDGGDVLREGDVLYVGRSGRTNDAAVEQLRALLRPEGTTVVHVDVRGALHLKSVLGTLPNGSLVADASCVDRSVLGAEVHQVGERAGAQVLVLGAQQLMLAADCPQSVRAYRELGYEVAVADISEFQKREAAVTCLSVLLPRR